MVPKITGTFSQKGEKSIESIEKMIQDMLNWKDQFLPALVELKNRHKRLEQQTLSIVGSSSTEESAVHVNYFQQILNPEEE